MKAEKIYNPIQDQYKGLKPSQVWIGWTPKQRGNFFFDHKHEFPQVKDSEIKNWTDGNVHYTALPEEVKQSLQAHILQGQYKEGGAIYSVGGKINKLNETYSFKDLFTKTI